MQAILQDFVQLQRKHMYVYLSDKENSSDSKIISSPTTHLIRSKTDNKFFSLAAAIVKQFICFNSPWGMLYISHEIFAVLKT